MTNPRKNNIAASIVWLAFFNLLVYGVVTVQLLRAAKEAPVLETVFGIVSMVAAVVGLALLVDWKNFTNMVSTQGSKEWTGFILAICSAALGGFALAMSFAS